MLVSLAAAGALLAVPAIGQAHHKDGHAGGGKGQDERGKGQDERRKGQDERVKRGGTGKSCAEKTAVKKGFVVKGTLVSYGAGTAAAGDETVTVNVTKMNRHASRSGLIDVDSAASGTQYSVTGAGAGGDPFDVRLSGYEADELPGAGDRVRIVGKVAVTRKRCAPAGASLEDRYGQVDVRKVKIVDAD